VPEQAKACHVSNSVNSGILGDFRADMVEQSRRANELLVSLQRQGISLECGRVNPDSKRLRKNEGITGLGAAVTLDVCLCLTGEIAGPFRPSLG
jgi:hypothetical protein